RAPRTRDADPRQWRPPAGGRRLGDAAPGDRRGAVDAPARQLSAARPRGIARRGDRADPDFGHARSVAPQWGYPPRARRWRMARRGAGIRPHLPPLRQQPHRRRPRALAHARRARGRRQSLLETGRKRPLVRGAVGGCDVRHGQSGSTRARKPRVDSTGAFEMTIRAKSSIFAALAATALLLAGCGSKSETEVASGTYTDPETGKTADYKISS